MTNHSHELARRETTRKAIERVLELAEGNARKEVDREAIAHVKNLYGLGESEQQPPKPTSWIPIAGMVETPRHRGFIDYGNI